MMHRLALLTGLMIVAQGCGPLTAAGAKVEIAETAGAKCASLGTVTASSAGSNTKENTEAARIEVRNQVGELGGDLLVIDSEQERGTLVEVSGRAYRCK